MTLDTTLFATYTLIFTAAFGVVTTIIGLWLSWRQVRLEKQNNQEQNTKIIASLQSIDESLKRML